MLLQSLLKENYGSQNETIILKVLRLAVESGEPQIADLAMQLFSARGKSGRAENEERVSALLSRLKRQLLVKQSGVDTQAGTEWGAIAETGSRLSQFTPIEVPGVSIVTCCMNRNENLKRSLASWLKLSQVDEIIIVDWNSAVPVLEDIRREGFPVDRVKVARVLGEDHWILSFAFNIGFKLASFSKILKLDADILLTPNFFQQNILFPDTYAAGDWRVADPGQAYTNGVLYCWRSDVNRVHGFNEHIQSYGWDDDELYARLSIARITRQTVERETVCHQDHADSARSTGRLDEGYVSAWDQCESDLALKIRVNDYISRLFPNWSALEWQRDYSISRLSSRNVELIGLDDVMPRLSREVKDSARVLALREVLSWNHGQIVYDIPSAEFRRMAQATALDELKRSNSMFIRSHAQQGPLGFNASARNLSGLESKLIVDCNHGLGNRLRALASAAVIAQRSSRELVVIWQPDAHCEARLDDLFVYEGALFDSREEFFNVRPSYFCYDHMRDDTEKSKLVDPLIASDIYVKTAYSIQSDFGDWDAECAFLQSLVPANCIASAVDAYPSTFDLGIHVRMVGAKGSQLAIYDSADNWSEESHEAIQSWRGKSHYKVFFAKVDDHLKVNPSATIFLASDSQEAYEAFTSRYNGRLGFFPCDQKDRSVEQIKAAMVDALLLSKSKILLGSNWSSFTELALRLGGGQSGQFLAGKDF